MNFKSNLKEGVRLARLCRAMALMALVSTGWGATTGETRSESSEYSLRPVSFEANEGQTDARVRFVTRGRRYAAFFTREEVVLALHGAGKPADAGAGHRRRPHPADEAVLRIRFAGANPSAEITGEQPTGATVNHLLGNDPSQWRTGLASFGATRYREIYPGTDLVFYGNEQQLEYDFVLAPGADPATVQLDFHGANTLAVNARGDLEAAVGPRTVVWKKPVAYQSQDGRKVEVRCAYRIQPGHRIAFAVGAYDRSKPLIIDPILSYSSFLGGSDFEAVEAVALTTNGSVFVAGETLSLNFPTTNGYQSTKSSSNDVFVSKFSTNGASLIFSTYLGGSGDDFAQSINVSASGEVFIAGMTESANFPMKNAFQSSRSGAQDAFFTKLVAAGNSLAYSTYLGGPGFESGNGVAVHTNGHVFLVGETDSGSQFPKKTPFQNNAGGLLDGFVAKFNPALNGSSSLIFSSWLGGQDDDRATAVALDPQGNAYVTGEIFALDFFSSSFPVLNAMQPVYAGGGSEAFVTKISQAGGKLFATFLGGTDEDSGHAITVDRNYIYVGGESSSADFPMVNPVQPGLAEGYYQPDGFVVRMGTNGANITFSTLLGGDFADRIRGIQVDSLGHIYVGGETASTNLPVTGDAFQPQLGGWPMDTFVAKINPALGGAGALAFSSYLGGSGNDQAGNGNCVAINGVGQMFFGGLTASTNFPIRPGAYRSTYAGGLGDAFIARIDSAADLGISVTMSTNYPVVGANFTYTIRVGNNGRTNFTGVIITNQLPPTVSHVSATSTLGTFLHTNGSVLFTLGTLGTNASATLTITVHADATGPITNLTFGAGLQTEANTLNNLVLTPSTIAGLVNLAVSSVAAPDPVRATSNLTFQITVQNLGAWPATSVRVTNTIPHEVNFRSGMLSQGTYSYDGQDVILLFGTIPAGGQATASLVMRVPAYGPVTNTLLAGTFDVDTQPANDTATTVTTVIPVADLSVFCVSSVATQYISSNVTFTTTVSNRGPSTATTLLVTNILPAGLAYVSASNTRGSCGVSGNTVTCSISVLASNSTATVTVIGSGVTPGPQTNSVAVGSLAIDLRPTNNLSLATATFVPLNDIGVSVSAPTNISWIGTPVTFSARVTNAGPSPAVSVKVTNSLPAAFQFVSATTSLGTYSVNGQSVIFDVGNLNPASAANLTVTATPPAPATMTSLLSGASVETDANPANNTAQVTLTAWAIPQISITKAGTNAVLLWPVLPSSFQLQSSSVDNTNWTAVSGTPVTTNGFRTLTNPMSTPNRFYRLRSP